MSRFDAKIRNRRSRNRNRKTESTRRLTLIQHDFHIGRRLYRQICRSIAMEKFPDHIDSPRMANGAGRTPSPLKPASGYGLPNGHITHSDRRPPATRKENGHNGGLDLPSYSRGHGRQKSIGDAIRTIRTRRGSVSQNAHEIADALRAPVSPKLVVCISCCNYHKQLSPSLVQAPRCPHPFVLTPSARFFALCGIRRPL